MEAHQLVLLVLGCAVAVGSGLVKHYANRRDRSRRIALHTVGVGLGAAAAYLAWTIAMDKEPDGGPGTFYFLLPILVGVGIDFVTDLFRFVRRRTT